MQKEERKSSFAARSCSAQADRLTGHKDRVLQMHISECITKSTKFFNQSVYSALRFIKGETRSVTEALSMV